MATRLPPFIDSVHAAELLGVTPETVLDWIAQGKLARFGGKASNPILRSSDVRTLAETIGVADEPAPRRIKSASARVQTRLTADARWSDVGEDEIREWARRADEPRRRAALKAAAVARQRLDLLARVLEEEAT